MSTCEACGGDGLIEVGAYRGDADDTTTRECRLCGGVVTASGVGTICPIGAGQLGVTVDEISFKDEQGQLRTNREVAPIEQASERLIHMGQAATIAGVTMLNFGPQSKTPQKVAAEYAARLNTDNERRQRESERKINSSIRCGREGHAWQLVRYITGGKVVKCSDCDKMRHRKQ